MNHSEELKVLTDSIERIAAMAPPLHLPYQSQSSWYSDQRRRTDALQAEITKLLSAQPPADVRVAELEAWKESALSVLNGINLQTVGMELDLKPGSDIGPLVLPGIQRLKGRILELEKALLPMTQGTNYITGEHVREARRLLDCAQIACGAVAAERG